ncbi:MAG: secondary thiamine-phosphate synthase enzyme YjbQ [Bacteroidetes bacterium]|nr:secondary thiamine-phosphate synthase enzyme YjbQ [Bacteroidota bacterium]
MEIFQKSIRLKPKSRGFHLVSYEIIQQIPEISQFEVGILNILIQHTSAGLTINENADPTVRQDFETYFNMLVPENPSLYLHTAEGLDDMTSHIKSSIFGATLTIPVTDGKLNLGTWQGIYLCEHRDHAHSRNLVVTIIGEKNE